MPKKGYKQTKEHINKNRKEKKKIKKRDETKKK